MDVSLSMRYIPMPMGSFFKVFATLSFYAALHSILLRHEVRLLFEATFGQRAFRGLFRLSYNLLAVVLFGMFLGYAAGLPDTPLVEIYGLGAWLLLAFRVAGVALIVWALRTHGFLAWLGVESFRAWKRGEDPRREDIDASPLVTRGPYRWVRHPMYAGAFVFLWAVPGWSLNYLAFSLAASVYLVIGARLEEARLKREHGKAYADYAARTPRFVPRLSEDRRARTG